MDKDDLDSPIADNQGILAKFLKNDVSLGITFARLAKTDAIADKLVVERAGRRAREAYNAVLSFLPRASVLDAQERKQIEDQLGELNLLLMGIPLSVPSAGAGSKP